MTKRSVRRSGLIMPVNNARFVGRAWTRGCDYIVLDLEDSVPEWQKSNARNLVKDAIQPVSKGGAEVFVRINHDHVQADLEAVVWPGLKRINYPKTESAEEIGRLDAIITRLERERGIRPGTVEIGPAIETAKGVANAQEIGSASARIVDFGGGAGYDMSRDLGVEMFVDFDQFVYGKGELELVARALDLEIVAVPYVPNLTGSVSDPDRAFREADAARKCGFCHGSGLHPNVVGPQISGFTPTHDEVEDARWVLERYRQIKASDMVWEEADTVTIDSYEQRRAEELLDWAQLCSERDREKAEAIDRAQAAEGDGATA